MVVENKDYNYSIIATCDFGSFLTAASKPCGHYRAGSPLRPRDMVQVGEIGSIFSVIGLISSSYSAPTLLQHARRVLTKSRLEAPISTGMQELT